MRIPDVFVRHVSEPLWDLYEGSVRLRTYRKLKKTQWASSRTLADAQNRMLRDICRHAAATSTLYRDRFHAAGLDPAGIISIADLKSLPLLSKSDIRERCPDIISDQYTLDQLVQAKTGGSTGVSLEIFCDRRGVEMRNGAALLADEWSGWRLGQPLASIWGNPPVPRTLKNRIRCTWKDRIIYLDTMKINSQSIDEFLEKWRIIKPGLLYGHAHSIYILAEELIAADVRLRPSGIVATSMMLIESERAVIEKAFGCKVTNRYGCEEVSLIACECQEHQGLHLNAHHAIVEFLREDGSPCTPGEDGRIVVTELINYGMPMIRYEVGDRGVPTDRTCPCGRGAPLMESLTGRTADFLVAEDGSRVAGISIIENTLTRFAGIRQLQIIQPTRGELLVNLVPGDGHGPDIDEQLVRTLREILGFGIKISITLVDRIPQESSGKYRFTICRV